MENNKSLPSPEIRVEKPNIEYAQILLIDYSGEVSENTAIHLYIYQHFLQAKKWEEFSEALEEIAITEMRHLEWLGETILKLGLKPIYATYNILNNQANYWSGSYVNYTDDLKKMLEIDINAETLAIKQYESHKNMINDKYIKTLIDRIIEDEKKHILIFKDLYSKLND